MAAACKKPFEYFQQAIRIDADYAPAYASLAQSYILVAGSIAPEGEMLAAAKKSAQKALALDPDLAEAHTALALLLLYEHNFSRAESEFKLAVTLDPNYATAHHWYAEAYLVAVGRFEEANREMQQALALDPSSRIIVTDLGVVLYFQRRYDEAYQQLTKAMTLDSGFSEAYAWRGRVLLQRGKYSDAIADIETAYRISPTSRTIAPILAYAYGLSGNRAKAQSRLQSLLAASEQKSVSPWSIGVIYLGLGDKARSFDWFEKAVRQHSIDTLDFNVAPECDPLRQDPRFRQLLADLNLPS